MELAAYDSKYDEVACMAGIRMLGFFCARLCVAAL